MGHRWEWVFPRRHAWQVFNLYAGLTRWCFPVFIMLSGMFLLDKRALPLTKLFFHNLLRLCPIR